MENVKIALRVSAEGRETYRFTGDGSKTDNTIQFTDSQGDVFEFQIGEAVVRMKKSGVSPLLLMFIEGQTTTGELKTEGMALALSVSTNKLIIGRRGFQADYRMNDGQDAMTHAMVLKWDGRTRDND